MDSEDFVDTISTESKGMDADTLDEETEAVLETGGEDDESKQTENNNSDDNIDTIEEEINLVTSEAENNSEKINDKDKPNDTKSVEPEYNKLFQLPMSRIRNLMKLDPDMNLASQEAVFIVTRATELFIESLARSAYTFTAQSKKKTVQKRDVNLAVSSVDSLIFLDGAMD
ncbi:DNA polymerase epsilon subunit 4 [Teleopsis dalmanni]|uniref:DNA polymerase epsilon subunit 4 n=1 Tax=Teleopsis dalmanni TaxID=139649 RepID=UPI0018CF5F40|nr:DNA polymerase epsilon subunit 4 [Teleopsis dalmanni]